MPTVQWVMGDGPAQAVVLEHQLQLRLVGVQLREAVAHVRGQHPDSLRKGLHHRLGRQVEPVRDGGGARQRQSPGTDIALQCQADRSISVRLRGRGLLRRCAPAAHSPT